MTKQKLENLLCTVSSLEKNDQANMLLDIYINLKKNPLGLPTNNKYIKTFFELTAIRDKSLKDGIIGFSYNMKNSKEIIAYLKESDELGLDILEIYLKLIEDSSKHNEEADRWILENQWELNMFLARIVYTYFWHYLK